MATDLMQGANVGEGMGAEEGGGGYCIEIYVGADGSISVATESKAAEDSEGEGGEIENRMPASSIKQALTMALDIYKNGGKSADNQEQADFDSGYGGKPSVRV